jgi:hypothetical protein
MVSTFVCRRSLIVRYFQDTRSWDYESFVLRCLRATVDECRPSSEYMNIDVYREPLNA